MENFLSVESAYMVSLIPKDASGWGYDKIAVEMNDLSEEFIFDTGFSGSFTTNKSFLEKLELGDILVKEVSTKKNKLNGKLKFNIQRLKVSTIEKSNIELTVEHNVSSLIGNEFLDDYLVTIDWDTNELYLEPVQN